MNLLKKGNHKLSKQVGIFTLPTHTCIGSGICRKFCYADKGYTRFKKCVQSRENKFNISRQENFIELITTEIKKMKKIKAIRIHESGDFYSQEYLNKWKYIAKQFPNLIFQCYTKSFILDLWSNLSENFIIFQSLGGKFDNKVDLTKNTARVDILKKIDVDEFICPYSNSDFTKCFEYCNECFDTKNFKHVVFHIH